MDDLFLLLYLSFSLEICQFYKSFKSTNFWLWGTSLSYVCFAALISDLFCFLLSLGLYHSSFYNPLGWMFSTLSFSLSPFLIWTFRITNLLSSTLNSLVAQMVKHLPIMQETWVRSLGQEDILEKELATHSSTLAWKIPWTEEPGRLHSMGLQRVEHNLVTSLHLGCTQFNIWYFHYNSVESILKFLLWFFTLVHGLFRNLFLIFKK